MQPTTGKSRTLIVSSPLADHGEMARSLVLPDDHVPSWSLFASTAIMTASAVREVLSQSRHQSPELAINCDGAFSTSAPRIRHCVGSSLRALGLVRGRLRKTRHRVG